MTELERSSSNSSMLGGAVDLDVAFIGVGCNRVVGAIAWGPCNLVAFAAHHSVAVFDPKLARVLTTLQGHKDLVNCVEWIPKHGIGNSGETGAEKFLLSGGADGGIFVWAYLPSENEWRVAKEVPGAHDKAVTCIAGCQLSANETLVASTSSDGTVRVWHASVPKQAGGACEFTMLQSISVGTKVMVAVTLSPLPSSSSSYLIAVGGLDNHVYLYVGCTTGQFKQVCQLKGHQDWIRALDFSCPVKDESGLAVFLASSAQDRMIRMWKICAKRGSSPDVNITTQPSLRMYIEGPVFKADGNSWQVSLESLLVGHEDWVYSVVWQPPQHVDTDGIPLQSMCVLSASMDRTMMIWKPDFKSGIWMNVVTVGELGHTALGFYGAAWGPQGNAILAHGYSGSLHMWAKIGDDWIPQLVPSGHSAPVVDLSWGKLDRYLLSASHDQTTRLFACWERDGDEAGLRPSWHEIARPQVHGHDFNCLAVVKGPGNHCYVSGADEKVARVFEAPGAFLDSLNTFTGLADADGFKREDVQIIGANMSALGLSQKPIYTQGAARRDVGNAELSGDPMMEELPEAKPMILTEPPLEEHLAHNTLWPETHKLYGHGNELFAMCCNNGGQLLATACKAQTMNVAEIWLWYVNSWRVAGRLQSHTLTVTQLEFSPDNLFLLSVSRDRHFTVFQLKQSGTGEEEVQHKLLARVDAHKRIIWACSWSPCSRFFATGSRDRSVKIWELSENGDGNFQVKLITALPLFKCSVTALAWAPFTASQKSYLLAVGKEDGTLEVWRGFVTPSADAATSEKYPQETRKLDMSFCSRVERFLCHGATIHRLRWRDLSTSVTQKQGDQQSGLEISKDLERLQLASCGADHTDRKSVV